MPVPTEKGLTNTRIFLRLDLILKRDPLDRFPPPWSSYSLVGKYKIRAKVSFIRQSEFPCQHTFCT